MGVDTDFGRQKYWFYGVPFDGMNVKENNVSDAKFGVGGPPQNDFIFAQDKKVSSVVIAGATVTATAGVKYSVSATVRAQARVQVFRNLPGVSPIYDGSRYWIYGLPTPSLLKNSFAGQQYWIYGNVDADVFPTTQAAIVLAGATVIANAGIRYSVSATIRGQATARVLRKIGGATDPQGGQKYWGTGLTTGFTFLALGNTVQTSDIAFFADQRLWYFGLPTPDMIGTVTTPVVSTSPAKMISAQLETKRQSSNWPTSIKIISAAIPTKRSSTI